MGKSVEWGFVVCRNGGYSRGPIVTGTANSVSIPIACPVGSKAVALHHLHPSGSLELSEQDITTGRQRGLAICVKARGIVKCYRIRRRR